MRLTCWQCVFEQLQLQGVYKNVDNSGMACLINFKFLHSVAEGVPYHMLMTSWGACRVCKMFFCLQKHQKQGKIQPGVSTGALSVPAECS